MREITAAEEERLAKYDKLNLELINKNFAIIPNKVINAGLTADELGLYVWLTINSGKKPRYKDAIVSTYQDKAHLSLKVRGGGRTYQSFQEKICKLLDSLEEYGFIKLELTKPEGDLLVEVIQDTDQGFCKVYSDSVIAVLNTSAYKNRLVNLATYTIFRSFVYESDQRPYNRVVSNKNRLMAKKLNTYPSTIRRRMDWLYENRVLAAFKCRMFGDYCRSQNFFSDLHDASYLVDYVRESYKSHEVKDILE